MTDTPIPTQPAGDGWDDPRNGRPPVHPSLSEAGRLLCAGTYIDSAFRDRVIHELYVHEERLAAPSHGYDATRVLAHALRARRAELGWAAAVLLTWLVGFLLTDWLLLLLFVPFMAFALARWLGSRGSVLLKVLAVGLRIYAVLFLVTVLLLVVGLSGDLTDLLAKAFGGDGSSSGSGSGLGSGYGSYEPDPSYGSSHEPWEDSGFDLASSLPLWGVIAVFAGLVTLVGLQRAHVARTIVNDLDPARYADHAGDPAEASPGARHERIRRRIRNEQWSPLVVYDVNDPLCGSGAPFRPWQLSVELRPRDGLGPDRKPVPPTNADLLGAIVPRLQQLRVPSPHGSRQVQELVRDRLRELVIEEVVHLPADGLAHRDNAPVQPEAFAEHRAASIEEGGERRRHFLRIRVGGWDENLVVTVFVRVHTQGGMLMLEFAPHVLLPLPVAYLNADADARRHLRNNWIGKAAWALVRTPGSFTASVVTLARGVASWWRIVTGGHGGARPDGAWASVRELASQDNGTIFHLMDLDRYRKTIEDRVVAGVTEALHEAGWHTEEFAQRAAVIVNSGGTYIQRVEHSAFALGGSGHTISAGHGGRGSGSGSGSGR
ncbi:hypothetical protein [Streptomyces sp. NPDC089799]|uniref:hypothetical protein n=1 Tax=Streptomyces sp. NPDC089799 TaxID=3155066 RepID=UPI00341E498B